MDLGRGIFWAALITAIFAYGAHSSPDLGGGIFWAVLLAAIFAYWGYSSQGENKYWPDVIKLFFYVFSFLFIVLVAATGGFSDEECDAFAGSGPRMTDMSSC